jgi:O-antigen/teichoic acid export membrane protein
LSVLAVVSLLLAAGVLWAGIGPKGLPAVVAVLALVITLMLFREYARRICFAHLLMKTALLVDVCVAVVQLGGLLLVARARRLSAGWAYLVAGVACLVASVVGLSATRRLFALRSADVVPDLARNWVLGRWMLISTVAATASSELYPWFLTAFSGTAATGVFAACSRVVYLANPFLMGMTNFLGPKAAHAYARGRGALDRTVIHAMGVVFGAMCAFFAVMLLLGGRLLPFLYGGRYAGYGGVVTVLAFRQLVGAFDVPVICGLLAVERPDIIFKSYVAGCVVTVGVGVPLAYVFGVGGAAWALVATTAVTVGLRQWGFWVRARKAGARGT